MNAPDGTPSAGAPRGRAGVKSVETGLAVLMAFTGPEPSVGLTTLAERCRMAPPKMHRYLVSLCRAGFVRRDPASARYALADNALKFGLAAVGNLQVTRLALPVMRRLRHDIRSTVVLSVWTAAGPTVVLEETYASGPFALTSRVGTILPCLGSATGRVFCAWLHRGLTQPFITRELRSLKAKRDRDTPENEKALETLLAGIRRRGLAREVAPDLHALSAPVFDMRGNVAAALCAMGPPRTFAVAWRGAIAREFAQAAASLSDSAGFRAAGQAIPA